MKREGVLRPAVGQSKFAWLSMSSSIHDQMRHASVWFSARFEPGWPNLIRLSLGSIRLAAGLSQAQGAYGAFAGVRDPWPAKRSDRSSAMVAAPCTFNLFAVLTDW